MKNPFESPALWEIQEPGLCGVSNKNQPEDQALAPYSGRNRTMSFQVFPESTPYLINPCPGGNYFPSPLHPSVLGYTIMHCYSGRGNLPLDVAIIWQSGVESTVPIANVFLVSFSGLFLEYNNFMERDQRFPKFSSLGLCQTPIQGKPSAWAGRSVSRLRSGGNVPSHPVRSYPDTH